MKKNSHPPVKDKNPIQEPNALLQKEESPPSPDATGKAWLSSLKKQQRESKNKQNRDSVMEGTPDPTREPSFHSNFPVLFDSKTDTAPKAGRKRERGGMTPKSITIRETHRGKK